MLRASICSLTVLALFVTGLAKANDLKSKSDKGTKHTQAIIKKVDAEKSSVTVTMRGRNGKEVDRTYAVAPGAEYFDNTGKAAKLDAFKPGDDVVITRKAGKITELRKHAEATITKVDAKDGTVTVKMMGNDGKEVEKTFQLTEDVEYIDTTGQVATLDVFQSGDEVLFIESEGKIKELKKDTKHNKTGDKHVSEMIPHPLLCMTGMEQSPLPP